MFQPSLACFQRGLWSDRHGVTERNSTLAFSRASIVPGDLPQDGLSRNTIRKYLRAGGVEPKFNVPERPSKLDPFADRLSAWLKTESKIGPQAEADYEAATR